MSATSPGTTRTRTTTATVTLRKPRLCFSRRATRTVCLSNCSTTQPCLHAPVSRVAPIQPDCRRLPRQTGPGSPGRLFRELPLQPGQQPARCLGRRRPQVHPGLVRQQRACFSANRFHLPRYGSADYGGYSSPATNSTISKALAAESASVAAGLWAQAQRQIINDAATVPLDYLTWPIYHSSWLNTAAISGGSASTATRRTCGCLRNKPPRTAFAPTSCSRLRRSPTPKPLPGGLRPWRHVGAPPR